MLGFQEGLAFYMGARDLNAGSHAGKHFTTELGPQPDILFLCAFFEEVLQQVLKKKIIVIVLRQRKIKRAEFSKS